MRLIDADALYDCVKARYRLSSGEEHKAERALLDAICGSPTIDAIPVGWLEDRVYDMKRAPLYRRYAEMLLMEWLQEQKEQEAQDG